jgi:hypothetical protein
MGRSLGLPSVCLRRGRARCPDEPSTFAGKPSEQVATAATPGLTTFVRKPSKQVATAAPGLMTSVGTIRSPVALK